MTSVKPKSQATGKSGQKPSAAVLAQAKELHGKIKQTIKGINSGLAALSKMLREMHDKQLHRFVPKSGSRKGYPSFRDYVASLGISGAKGSRLVAIGGLMEGPNALLPEEVEQMPEANAHRLAQVPPEHRTREVVRAAKETEPKKLRQKFQELGVPMEDEPRGVFARTWPLLLIERAEEVEREGAFLTGVRDGDRSWTLSQKAMFAAFTFFLEAHREEIERDKADAAQRLAAETSEMDAGADAPEGEIVDPNDYEQLEEEPVEAGD